MNRFSLITLNRGRDGHLTRCLEGVARGLHVPDETIVVAMDCRAPAPIPGITVVHAPDEGLALGRARNLGRQKAQCEILVFLDVDCIPSQDLVGALGSAASAYDGLICGEVIYLTQTVEDGWTDQSLRTQGRRHPARVFLNGTVALAPNAGLFWSLAFAVRANTFDRLGGFDESFTGYGGEDTDLAFRAVAAGVPILFEGNGCAFHQRHAVYDPPLNHCADIVANANRFHARHGVWPMRGWLEAFAALGLVTFGDATLTLLRLPTAAEIAAHRVPPDKPF